MGFKIATQRRSANRISRSIARPAHSTRVRPNGYHLQRTIGNSATSRFLLANHIQAKLNVTSPQDASERKADRVADTVMRMTEPEVTDEKPTRVQAKPPAAQIRALVQRESEQPHDEQKGETVAAKPVVLHDGLAATRARAPLRRPTSAVGYGGGPNLHGQADAVFDGGKKKISNLKTSRATGCDCAASQSCMKATGTLEVTYKVKVTITMPPMPSGLSKCKQDRVTAFFKNVLGPHEQKHKRGFETYNGTTRHPIEGRGCGQDEAKSALDTEAQRIYDDESAAREKAARQESDKLDPFFELVDFDGCK